MMLRGKIYRWASAAAFLGIGIAIAFAAGNEAVNLGSNVNSPDNDFGPIVTAKGNTLYFTSTRDGGKGGQDIWVSHREKGEWQKAVDVAELNTKFHEGPDSFSLDEKTMFFTRCDKIGQPGPCDIYTASWDEEKKQWTNIKPLGQGVNTEKFSETNASISADGKTLYFISNRPGGPEKKEKCPLILPGQKDQPLAETGDNDIYVSRWEGKDWGLAEPLPEPINTCGDEFHVIIHPDSQTLYFSSNGLKGLGGADIFRARIVEGKFQNPENLGEVVNTPGDDIYFTIPASGELAYFASDRPGTLGLLDIYAVPLPIIFQEAKPVFILRGVAADKSSCTDPSQPATCKPLAGVKITARKAAGELLKETVSAKTGSYQLSLPVGEKIELTASAAGFHDLTVTIDSAGFKPYHVREQHLLLQAK